MSDQKKAVLITGCSSGIGRATATMAARAAAKTKAARVFMKLSVKMAARLGPMVGTYGNGLPGATPGNPSF